MSFSDRLKELRLSRNLTQKQVYEAVKMSAIPKLLALADFFDVSLDYLAGRSDDPARH